jgi:hypothetical protein
MCSIDKSTSYTNSVRSREHARTVSRCSDQEEISINNVLCGISLSVNLSSAHSRPLIPRVFFIRDEVFAKASSRAYRCL